MASADPTVRQSVAVTKVPGSGRLPPVGRRQIMFGGIGLAAVALAIVAFVSVTGTQAHRSRPSAVLGQTNQREPGASPAPSSPVTPTSTPASASPGPPPPPPDPYMHVGSQGPDVQA